VIGFDIEKDAEERIVGHRLVGSLFAEALEVGNLTVAEHE
jgi:hypothetical protein